MHFYPRPPRGGRPAGARGYAACGRISIHALREEGDTVQNVPGAKLSAISIHALREEGDAETKHLQELSGAFLSTPSARRATSSAPDRAAPSSDFYPRPPRGGRQCPLFCKFVAGIISIHALREEGDSGCPVFPCFRRYFYPRPPRGGRPFASTASVKVSVFLSTPSARRATPEITRIVGGVDISIHALREEGDHSCTPFPKYTQKFLSTPSARRATGAGFVVRLSGKDISIHALREEGDSRYPGVMRKFHYFYPRPPRGGRPTSLAADVAPLLLFLSTPSARRATGVIHLDRPRFIVFLSTPSARRATLHSVYLFHADGRFLSTPSARRATKMPCANRTRPTNFYPRPPRGGRRLDRATCVRLYQISIHALREEGDTVPSSETTSVEDFYPRPPRGGRPEVCGADRRVCEISIHALREEGDSAPTRRSSQTKISIHALREEGDTDKPYAEQLKDKISIHALREEGDRNGYRLSRFLRDFYPRPPRGGRPQTCSARIMMFYFYPRPPRGGRRQRRGQIHRKF